MVYIYTGNEINEYVCVCAENFTSFTIIIFLTRIRLQIKKKKRIRDSVFFFFYARKKNKLHSC